VVSIYYNTNNYEMSAGSQATKPVIRAVKMFSQEGMSSKASATKEIVIGLVLGLGAGFVWQTYHWKENERWESMMPASKK
jgi:hypothetical protein